MAVRKSTIKKRKDLKRIEKGQVHVHTTHNNTIVTVTDMVGNTISWASAGVLGLKGSRKETAFAATQATEKAVNEAKMHGVRKVEVYIKGTGQGREPSIRAIQACEVDITMIKDVSPIPHNGCRPPKRRRL
ncbi:MAG: 30S ribosomal protein S11 [Clostridiales bacterium]|jgi:small subunit ribosomal protein S11|nr:30S ribosomal protein S11 [Clostridiales bacterium]MDY4654929.1 30S ribosomal protein S11 [Eubacteriales bacterium]